MDCVRTGLSLPDEVLVALSHFLHYNITETATSTPDIGEKESSRMYYAIDNDSDYPRSIGSPNRRSKSKDSRFSMQRNTKKQEEPGCRSPNNGPANRQSSQSGVQGKLAPNCSKNKDFSDCNPSKCQNNPPHHQEKRPVYPCQAQALGQQIKRPQAPPNRSQQFQQRSCRSQSIPKCTTERYNASDRYDDQGPRGLYAGQENTNPPRGCCGARNPQKIEGDANTSNIPADKNSRSYSNGNWNNSSQVGTNYGEWQRRQQQQQPRQQQKCGPQNCPFRQSNEGSALEDGEISGFEPDLDNKSTQNPTQSTMSRQYAACNKCSNSQSMRQQQQPRQQQKCGPQNCPFRQQQSNGNISDLDDGEISGFEPDLNSTMMNEKKRCHKSTQNRTPSTMPRQYADFSKCNSSQNYETPQMPRRAPQYGYSQTQSRHTQCESQTMPERKSPQQYETIINETSYLDLPDNFRSNMNKNRCRNIQTQGLSNTQRSRSLSPYNCSKYKSYGGNNTNMEMDDSDFYPEDTNCGKCQPCSTVSRAMLQRSCLNETSLDKTNKCWAGRSTRTYTKTPEDYLAERTHVEFMEALVKDRGCPGFIQSTLNGNENFNEFAFDIAFPGPIPAKPFPVDPITLVEAIKLRIDHEREEIRRNYRPIATENIDTHFFDKNKTEVNEAVAAFLKAESQYLVNKEPDTFDAHINGLDTNMFDESIKLNVYSATTKPGQEVLDLSHR